MNLYIFVYSNYCDFTDVHWAKANTEEEARVALAGRDWWGTQRLGRSYKVAGIFPLADEQNHVKPKEAIFPAHWDDSVQFAQAVERASYNRNDIGSFRAGVQWMLDKLHGK